MKSVMLSIQPKWCGGLRRGIRFDKIPSRERDEYDRGIEICGLSVLSYGTKM